MGLRRVWTMIAAVLLSTSAYAPDELKLENIDPKGMPEDYKPGSSSRYAIWKDAEGWHFRFTTSSQKEQAFKASIGVVGGNMVTFTTRGQTATGKELENDGPQKYNLPGYQFDLPLKRRMEHGIDFTLDDKAKALKFDLKINGQDLPEQIYIGAKGAHPKKATFHLAVK